jgi:hypothetical protein
MTPVSRLREAVNRGDTGSAVEPPDDALDATAAGRAPYLWRADGPCCQSKRH